MIVKYIIGLLEELNLIELYSNFLIMWFLYIRGLKLRYSLYVSYTMYFSTE